VHEDVFWFYISVNDVTVVHKLNGMTDLLEYASSLLLWESTLLL